ncbi:hypothetical protein PR202_ga16739 [Eleusine coracana subsp. coracana]|uniref:Uncharacterized protein n=1 Tax=Eleusine coracana subsp. coracana TaxID=191504 RepID=A0AAV5CP15_ELECO|nr:hypothetical protein PR202_ga16739 [Eleusine coracana subsp. coracana]
MDGVHGSVDQALTQGPRFTVDPEHTPSGLLISAVDLRSNDRDCSGEVGVAGGQGEGGDGHWRRPELAGKVLRRTR